MSEFNIGDRVRIKAQMADRYIQPWRDRFKKGRAGTVVKLESANVRGLMVEFDHKNAKRVSDWRIVIHRSDLELAP